MGDLLVEWNRDAPIDTVWSPATGVVTAPYLQWRTGDHHRAGLLLASGPGIEPGRARARSPFWTWRRRWPPPLASIRLRSTASRAPISFRHRSVRPGDAPINCVDRTAVERPAVGAEGSAPVLAAGARRTGRTFGCRSYAVGLSRALHAEHSEIMRTPRRAPARLDRASTTSNGWRRSQRSSAWLRHVDVPESLLVSVVMPTRNRRRPARAGGRVGAGQTYANWEMLVVDDASTDDTVGAAAEARRQGTPHPYRSASSRGAASSRRAQPRARARQGRHRRVPRRRQPLRSRLVARGRAGRSPSIPRPKSRTAHGSSTTTSGTRDCPGRSMPIVQFLAWDRRRDAGVERVDQNVIAHRPSPARLDEISRPVHRLGSHAAAHG